MNPTYLNWAYTFCLVIGTGYTVVAFFLGHSGGDGAHGGGHGHGGDHGGGGDVDSSVHLPLFSPIAIAVFLTAFGAGGLVGQEVFKGRSLFLPLAAASGAGLAFGLTIAAAMGIITKKTVSTSHALESDAIGAEATVLVTIPQDGVGKIGYEVAGSRFTASARSIAGGEIRQDVRVVIRRKEGMLYLVEVA